jgi:hypothetical protein
VLFSNRDGEEASAKLVFAVRNREISLFDDGIGYPEPVSTAAPFKAPLHTSLGVPERSARLENLNQGVLGMYKEQ